MPSTQDAFVGQVEQLLGRYLRQNGLPPLKPEAARALGTSLWAELLLRGVPGPPGPGDLEPPEELGAADVAPAIARLLREAPGRADLEVPARQLVKGCLQPEFARCRQSYREPGSDGVCRRQDLARARSRLSGSHCVDCPYWTSLGPGEHAQLLSRAFGARATEFEGARSVFLPEDYRALRRRVREAARTGELPARSA